MAPPVVLRIEGVDYNNLESIRGNALAKDQLAAVMREQFSLCNLEFLDQLDALIEEKEPNKRLTVFNSLFESFVDERAGDRQIMFKAETSASLLAAKTACENPASAPSVIGFGTAFDKLLEQSKSEVANMCQTAMRTLDGRFPEVT